MTKPGGIPVEVQCGKCGYLWTTKSRLHSVSCPDCGYTNRNKDDAIERAKKFREAEAEKNAGTNPT